MALTTYRSIVAITTIPLRDAAYDALRAMLGHLITLNLNMTRVQLMGDNFVEVDLNNPLPVEQVAHFKLQGPV